MLSVLLQYDVHAAKCYFSLISKVCNVKLRHTSKIKENLYCEPATEDVTDNRQNPASFHESSKSISIWCVVPILKVFLAFARRLKGLGSQMLVVPIWLLLGDTRVWGQFSQTHYSSLGRPYLPNFVKIGQTVSLPGRV